MANKHGIDISRYQGKPDFAKLKNEVDFVIVQAGYGRLASQKDPEFERTYSECRKNGIPVGVYWFSYAATPQEARFEATACMDVIRGKQFEYPIYFDIEGNACSGDVSGKCRAFCDTLEAAGYYSGIYISRSPAQTYLNDYCIKHYALWLAEYGSRLNWTGGVGMWQNSSTGHFSGISGNVDTDICYEDYPKIIKQGGFNGYPKADPKPLDTEGFKRGDKSLGVYYLKQRLKAKGHKVDDTEGFGGGTENAVNEILTASGYEPNGIAGKGFARLVMR